MSIIATLLVIFGNDINRYIRRLVKKFHFLVRLVIFVLVCALGYGVATIFLAQGLQAMLKAVPREYLVVVVAAIFFLLGLAAEERKQI